MSSWVRVLVVGAVLLSASWVLLFLAAKRLPPGIARDLVGLLPDCTTLVWRLRRDPTVPTPAKVAIAIAAIWVASPIDLIPEFLPIIGPLDDVIVVAIAVRYAGRRVPRETILEAWPGEPHVIDKLLGKEPPSRRGACRRR